MVKALISRGFCGLETDSINERHFMSSNKKKLPNGEKDAETSDYTCVALAAKLHRFMQENNITKSELDLFFKLSEQFEKFAVELEQPEK